MTTTHTRTVKRGPFGGFVVKCSCGWGDEWTALDTELLAMAAGDRHVAAEMQRSMYGPADTMEGRCEEDVADGPDPDDTDICSALLSADGTCPNAHHHI